MVDLLVERRIIRVYYHRLPVTNKHTGKVMEGKLKEKQCATLLRPYTECTFSATAARTLESQTLSYAKVNGATGFCYGELQTRFGLSRRSARSVLLPLAKSGHLGSKEGVHQVSWDATVRTAENRERVLVVGLCLLQCALLSPLFFSEGAGRVEPLFNFGGGGLYRSASSFPSPKADTLTHLPSPARVRIPQPSFFLGRRSLCLPGICRRYLSRPLLSSRSRKPTCAEKPLSLSSLRSTRCSK